MESSSQQSPQLNVYLDALPYVRKVLDRWVLIAVVVWIAMFVTALYDILFATRWYLASAIIRPISASAVQSRIAGFTGGLGGGSVSQLGGLAAAVGGGGGTDADEYMAILQGFSFSTNLAHRHGLEAELLERTWLDDLVEHWSPSTDKWRIYRTMASRFDCDYSRTTGNMEVSYSAKSGADAERVLGFYISDLRDLLRSREIVDASTAVDTLRDEAQTSPDPMLRSELYVLEAKQIERKKMAQVEAEFAFRVLDPPAAPDKKDSPKTTLDSIVVGLVVAFVAAGWVLVRPGPTLKSGRNISLVRPLSTLKADPFD